MSELAKKTPLQNDTSLYGIFGKLPVLVVVLTAWLAGMTLIGMCAAALYYLFWLPMETLAGFYVSQKGCPEAIGCIIEQRQLLGSEIILVTIVLAVLMVWKLSMRRDVEWSQRRLPVRPNPAYSSGFTRKVPSGRRPTCRHDPHLRCSLQHTLRKNRAHRRNEDS